MGGGLTTTVLALIALTILTGSGPLFSAAGSVTAASAAGDGQRSHTSRFRRRNNYMKPRPRVVMVTEAVAMAVVSDVWRGSGNMAGGMGMIMN